MRNPRIDEPRWQAADALEVVPQNRTEEVSSCGAESADDAQGGGLWVAAFQVGYAHDSTLMSRP